MPAPLIVGRIGSTYGIQGWVKIISFTEPYDNILNYNPWQLFINGHWCSIRVLNGKKHGSGVVAQLEGYHNPEAVRQLVNLEIGINKEQLPALPPGEYYWADLIGITVLDTQDKVLGTIASLFATGANDVIVVKGEKEVLIPYIPQVVLTIDLERREMRVDWEWT